MIQESNLSVDKTVVLDIIESELRSKPGLEIAILHEISIRLKKISIGGRIVDKVSSVSIRFIQIRKWC